MFMKVYVGNVPVFLTYLIHFNQRILCKSLRFQFLKVEMRERAYE